MRGSISAADRIRLFLLASASAFALAVAPAVAQEAAEGAESIELAPLEVRGTAETLPAPYAGGQVATGARIGVLGDKDIMDVPFSVTSYTEELIRNQQAETIGDVVANDPSVRTSYGFGIFGEQFVIRGFELFSDDIAIDGVYGVTPRQLPGIEMFERVEVLKGASAFLNGVPPGGSGIGGSINLVPKRAHDVPMRRVTAGYSMDSQVSGHADVGHRFGANNEWGVRLNVAGRTGETAIDNEERDYLLGAAAIDYRGEDFRISLDAVHQKHRVDQGRPIVQLGALTSVPDAPDSTTNYGASWLYSEMEDSFVLLKGEYDLTENLTAYAAAGVREMREDSDGGSPTLTALNGNATVVRGTVAREDSVYTAQGGVRADFVTGPVSHDLNAGASLTSQRNRNAYEFSDFGAPLATNIYNPASLPRPAAGAFVEGSLDNPPLAEKVELSSLYLSDTLSFLNDDVHLTLGVRDQRIHVRGYNRTTGAVNADYDESETSPFAGVAVNVTDQVTVYANVIEGLAQGPTSPPAGVVNPNQTFAPFVSEQYEVGGKVDLGHFGFGAALFQTEQPSAYTNAASVFVVDGEQRNRGLEITMFGEPAEGVRLLGGVTFLDAELTSTALGANDGNTAVGVPDYLVNVTGEWDLPFLAGVTATARVLYTAEQYADAANNQEVPDWARLDIGARYTADFGERPVTFNLFIENVTDESYWASANGGYLTMGDPLTAKFSVSTEF